MTTGELEKYIKQAKFINETEDVDEEFWPRDPDIYSSTQKLFERKQRLSSIVTDNTIRDTIKNGDLHSAISNTVSFVNDADGVAIYVIVSSELLKLDGSYPINPSRHDYVFNIVSLWVYTYDRNLALKNSWTEKQLKDIQMFHKEQADLS